VLNRHGCEWRVFAATRQPTTLASKPQNVKELNRNIKQTNAQTKTFTETSRNTPNDIETQQHLKYNKAKTNRNEDEGIDGNRDGYTKNKAELLSNT